MSGKWQTSAWKHFLAQGSCPRLQSIMPSLPPEASVCPSGEKATDTTGRKLPSRVCRQALSLTRQILMVPFLLLEASVCPSGAKATENTEPKPFYAESLQAGAIAYAPELDGTVQATRKPASGHPA